jgi:8-oxo-dGTP pyrophosphatase MutT (NUDIX family)
MKNFINFLAKLRKEDLPGIISHQKMIPYKSNPNIRTFEPKEDSKLSSVLILFIEDNRNQHFDITFTLRSSKLRKHSGQISFPGGKRDCGENNIDTALRESNEEIGLNPKDVEIITELSTLYVPPSNSIVSPIVAYTNKELKLTANQSEVDEIIFRPFDVFLNNNNLKLSSNLYPNQLQEFPYWDINHRIPLWGATAIMLQEVIDLYDIYGYKQT